MTLEEVAENHGLTPEGVDYALRQYQIVMCEITHGMMSKLSYDAKDVIRYAQERWCDTCELKETVNHERRYLRGDSKYSDLYKCCSCGYLDLRYKQAYCGGCGRPVKWDD